MHIDLIIIGIFLVITLAVGLYCGKGIKTFQDYAVGNRKMSSLALTTSLIATTYGGAILISRLDAYYRQGFYVFIKDLASPVSFFLAARFVIIRMQEFIGHLSIAESMGSLYGPAVRIITGILGIMMNIALIVPQFKVGLIITTTLCPEIEQFSTQATLILAALVICYSTFGGAKSVVLTDVYQFFLFGICFPILIFILLYYTKNLSAGWQKLTSIPQFNIGQLLTWNDTLTGLLAYFIWHAVFPFDPARIQRFYMASSVQQAAAVFNKSTVIRVIFTLLFLSVAVALHLGGHVIKPNQTVLDYLIKLSYFPSMRGILVTAIFALLMSTADSNLHAASVLYTNDVLPVLASLTKHESKPSLRTVRIASAFIGLTSLLVMLYTTNLLQLLSKAVHFYGPSVAVPLIMATFGFRPRSAAVLLTMGINIAIAIYRIYYKTQTISHRNVFESLILSMLILITMHYLLPKRPYTGWIGIKDRSPLDLQNQETKRWWIERYQHLKALLTKKYWVSFFPKKESTFTILGIYLITSSLITLCLIGKAYIFPYIYWHISIMAVGTILTVYPAFHSYKEKGNTTLHWTWPGLLFISLFISSIQLTKLSHFSPIACTLLICSLCLGIVLLSLTVGLGMFTVAMITHKLIPPSIPFWNLFWTSYKAMSTQEIVFSVALGVVAVVGLSTYKYLRDKTNAKFQVIELGRTYERRISLEAIYNQVNWSRLDPTYGSKMLQEMAEMLQEPCHYLYTHDQKKFGDDINSFIRKVHKFRHFLLQRAKEEHSLELNQKSTKPVAIEPVILKAHGIIRKLEEPMQLLLRNQTQVTQLIADPDLFERFLIINLLEISKSDQALDHIVTLTISDTTLRYDYAIATQSGQSALTLPALAFFISTDTSPQKALPAYDITDELTPVFLPKTEHQLYQAESRQIVQAHGGYFQVIETKQVLTCLYVLPVSGQNVIRFKTYNPATLALEAAETPESLIQEKELVTLLTTETVMTKETVEKAIAFIKNAHGSVRRKCGAPYYTHPMAVAKTLLDVTKDPVTILAGLLHDVVEDTPVTLNQIALIYGRKTAYIVDMVTHYNTNGYRWKLDDSENKNILDQCKDIRVVYVKLADRMHNIRTLHFRKPADQKRIAKETIAFYIPWGKKNKVIQWLSEMTNTCETILNKQT